MPRYIMCAVVALLLTGAPPASAQAPQSSRPGKAGDEHRPSPPKWWMDEKMRAELAITDQQSSSVEAVWQKCIPRLRELREKVDALDNSISQMIRDATDEATLTAQLDRVESMRAELNKGRTLMLYRMNRVLTPDQRVKLRAMWEREHGGGDRRRP